MPCTRPGEPYLQNGDNSAVENGVRTVRVEKPESATTDGRLKKMLI